jgi:hypothetical protein
MTAWSPLGPAASHQLHNFASAPPPPSPLLDPGCSALDAVHALTGLPWWAAIPLTTWGLKTALMPLSVRQARIVRSNMALWQESFELSRQREAKEAAAVRARLEEAVAAATAAAADDSAVDGGRDQQRRDGDRGEKEAAAAAAAAAAGGLAAAHESVMQLQRWQRRVRLFHDLRVKCAVPHPGWFFVNNLVQWPVFVYLGICVRSMAQRLPPWPGLEEGGALWFTDLTLPAVSAAGGSIAAAAAAGGGWVLPMGAGGLGLPLLVTAMMVTSIRIGFKATGGFCHQSFVMRLFGFLRPSTNSKPFQRIQLITHPVTTQNTPGAASRHPSVTGTFLQPLLRYAPAVLYSLTLVSLYFKLQLPQAVLLHWMAASGFTLSLQLALRNPTLRSALGYGGAVTVAQAGAAVGACSFGCAVWVSQSQEAG